MRQFKPVFTSLIILVLGSCNPGQKIGTDQSSDPGITSAEATRIETVLASDAMRGRKIFTPEIDKAADFIAEEFKAAGLTTWNDQVSFRQEFSLVRAKQMSLTGTIDGVPVSIKEVVVITCQPGIKLTQADQYEQAKINADDNLLAVARNYARSGKNLLVTCDKKHAGSFENLNRLKSNLFKTNKNIIFLLAETAPARYEIEAIHEITEQKLANVVGVLPGRSKKNEYVIFSGHYDHLGIGKPVNGDSIYNGANDDAAGVTAVMLLAKYFKEKNDNERTLVFAAFTAEESGGYGSQYFSKQFDPVKVVAMFNIEMIGTESKWGKNSAYITGYDKTDMGSILQKNLEGTGFTFHPDPYPTQNLFYRSDNATLARLGVPAHTISTAKMDGEPHYHKVTDHVETLDMENMAMIIKSIAISAVTIVSGKDTPSRVAIENLR